MKTKLWVDPPSGWMFGFPKIWNQEEQPELKVWLVEEGYPKEELERLGDQLYCRFWEKMDEKQNEQ
jgi:hypothetical protein